jgi:hypothetical protein
LTLATTTISANYKIKRKMEWGVVECLVSYLFVVQNIAKFHSGCAKGGQIVRET